jgi:lipopolysaccharide/colanic/teichoic acid biosynthesis glycosyltransferase
MKNKVVKILNVISVILAIISTLSVAMGCIDRKNKGRNRHIPNGIYEAYIKRPLDFFCAALALLIFWPLLLVIALLVRINLGSPVIFTQERPGKDERIFKLYKFRTMTDKWDADGNLLPDEERLTKFGKWLRSTSLDELPELVNILKGDMSVVGPRPLLVEYLPYYNEGQHHRHDVRPGLTGYAQTHGRNALTWDEKFDMDIKYVNSITFIGDLKIILDTLVSVVKRDGISSETSATMESFIDYCASKEKSS